MRQPESALQVIEVRLDDLRYTTHFALRKSEDFSTVEMEIAYTAKRAPRGSGPPTQRDWSVRAHYNSRSCEIEFSPIFLEHVVEDEMPYLVDCVVRELVARGYPVAYRGEGGQRFGYHSVHNRASLSSAIYDAERAQSPVQQIARLMLHPEEISTEEPQA